MSIRNFSSRWPILSNFLRTDDLPDDVSIPLVGKAVLRRWPFILVVAGVMVGFAILNVQMTPRIYEAEMLVAPTIPPSKSDSRAVLSSSGISSLLGGNSPTEVSDFSIFTTLLTSTEVASRLDVHYHILRLLYSQRWDSTINGWRVATGPIAALKLGIKAVLNLPTRAPMIQDLANSLMGIVTVADVGRTGMKRITVRYPDASMALKLLQMISTESDRAVRENEQQRTQAYIKFLQDQLMQVTLNEQRQALTQILATEERDRMLSSIDMPFSYKLIEQPRLEPDPIEPQPIRTVILAMVWGTLVGVFLVLARIMLVWNQWRKPKE